MGYAEFDFGAFTRQLEMDAAEILSGGSSSEERISALQLVRERAEGALTLEQGACLSEIACGPACGHCCVVNVAVLPPEAESIVADLRRRLSSEDLTGVARRLEDLYCRIVGLDDDDRPLLYAPCAFLDETKSCSIHPVRPLMCRSITSTDPQACREAISLQAFGENPTILSNLFQSALFEHSFIALARALARTGNNSSSSTLTASTRQLLLRPPDISPGNSLSRSNRNRPQ
ncbi:MAG: YkgJ family cysteine cluster protein [Desulfuromonadales bacterium]